MQPWADQNITSGVASQVETQGESAEGRIAIRSVESSGRRRWDRKALGLDVVVGVARIRQ
jgi:hypothetical protein